MSSEEKIFSFVIRPKPVAGDMRIAWRLAITLLILYHSKGKKASLAKLNLMNDAIRSENSRSTLVKLLSKETPLRDWRIRVEPAFSRNLDFLVGEGLAEWIVASNRASVQLNARGIAATEEVMSRSDLLEIEKEFIKINSSSVTEKFVKQVITAGRGFI